MDNAVRYICNPEKTEKERYITGINTVNDPRYAMQGMHRVKERYGKTGGVLAYHMIQSFKPGETDAETAHQIGVKFAKRVFGDKYEVLVTTHTDTKHIHNHILINSVSYLTGEKYHDGGRKNLDYLRSVSDTLCREYHLSVIEEPKQSQHLPYNLKQEEKQGKQTIRDVIREDIDEAIRYARNIPHFLTILQKMDYEVSTEGKYLKVKPFGRERFFRVYNLGKEYTEEELIRRIQERGKRALVQPAYPIHRYRPQQKDRLYAYTRRHSGFISDILRTYLYYRNILQRLQKQTYLRRPPVYLREDLQQLKSYSDQALVLAKYKVRTMPQLQERKEIIQQEIRELNHNRNVLRRVLRSTTDNQEISDLRSQIADISAKIKPKFREVKLFEEVEKRAVWVIRKAEKVAGDVMMDRENNLKHEKTI